MYAQSYGQDPLVEEVRTMTDDFAERTGRRPRILVAKMGQDGHDRGAKVVSSAYADLGFDVDVGPLFQTPEETAKMAIENDVHMIGMSSLWPRATRCCFPPWWKNLPGRAVRISWSSAAVLFPPRTMTS